MIALLLALASAAEVPPPPESWSAASPAPLADAPWWVSVSDPALDTLLDEALSGNLDLAVARARVSQSEALARQAFGGLLPQANLVATGTVAPFDSLGFQFGGGSQLPDPPKTYESGSAMVQAAWDVDVFGRQVTAARAGRFDAQAAAGDREAVAMSVAERVAAAYFDAVSAEARLGIVKRQVASAQALLELVEIRFERGEATALDVLQQRQQVASISMLVPQLQGVRETRGQQLAVLLGRAPSQAPDVPGALSLVPPVPSVGVPADLLENRPDLRAAAARADAAQARKASAFRAMLPSVRLTAQAGWQAIDTVEANVQDTWSAGGSVTVPLFQGGRLHAGLRAAAAAEDAATAQYAGLLLQAMAEVEGALVLESRQREQVALAEAQHEAARLAWEEARQRYGAGVATYLQVLTAQNAALQSELGLVQARRDLISARIQLHDATGGPWTHDLASTP